MVDRTAKGQLGNRVLAFVENGLYADAFLRRLYHTCYQHLFGHIAHTNRYGLADT
ncbi:hypothetical protein [Streptomyces sp. NPDC007088]|uniref:hypothetical protein n=1 Tax=Streptomyces sp. NPDC007088 TaxID=3364773 RepID=UPI0036B45B1B